MRALKIRPELSDARARTHARTRTHTNTHTHTHTNTHTQVWDEMRELEALRLRRVDRSPGADLE